MVPPAIVAAAATGAATGGCAAPRRFPVAVVLPEPGGAAIVRADTRARGGTPDRRAGRERRHAMTASDDDQQHDRPLVPAPPAAAPALGRRVALAGTVAAAATGLLARPTLAQGAFPERPIRMICPWPPGGSTDIQTRAICDAASRRLGQPIVIDNRPGVSGTLGAQAVKDARPDGYTLTQMPISVFRLPQMMQRPNFDTLNDFTWIIHVTGYLFGVVVRADRPWRTWQDFIAYAKANPGKVTYGTPGVASSLHITMEQIAQRLGIEWTHVPFRGGAENQQATLAGTVDATADSTGWAPLVEAGQLRLLVVWSSERAKRFPDVPTLRETGIDIVSESPYGFAGPKGMEPAVVRRLHDAFKEALYDPAHLQTLERLDMQPVYLNSEDYAAFARRLWQEEGEMIRRLGLRLN
jgi:tripartite-type tricarboxylate transporter receptor subunit TctC